MSPPYIEAIFVATKAGEPMTRVTEVKAIAGVGLCGDRYATGEGYYAPSDVCEVTLIEGEALDVMRTIHGIHVHNGEHRRNMVTRGLALRELAGKRLRIGEVLLEYERPRPPCGYVERLTEKGMTRALEKAPASACVFSAPDRYGKARKLKFSIPVCLRGDGCRKMVPAAWIARAIALGLWESAATVTDARIRDLPPDHIERWHAC